jgi:sec-independent protein translocase protein TatA
VTTDYFHATNGANGGVMSLGFTELILILVIVLVLFGAGKLPRVMGDLGKGMRSFKEGLKEETKDDGKKE